MWKLISGTVVILLVLDNASSKGLPSYLKLCKRRSGNLRTCVAENVELLRPHLKKGIPELFIPSMDPLIIPEATLNSGDQFKATFRNIEMYHAENFKVDTFNFDLDHHHVDAKLTFPLLRIKSNYNINGRLLILQLNGQGPADGNYTNVRASLSLKGTPFKKNNKEYIRWEKEKIDIGIEKSHLSFDRLFGDNAQLNEQTNRAINDNIDGIIQELQPVIQGVVSDFVFTIINRVFARYSVNELFIS
ncbi:uncharacterized protein LOC115890550 [Sitophilus oryzae]|uniref:Uncharacterized protein LOC115890550 n=1 Tax=Sitophilus oryzae TaxID=7048 RepID=A0A6J2YU14_SITOR|nr:uncharacterized protein LOC115890550 [Sitophilus oryzae]